MTDNNSKTIWIVVASIIGLALLAVVFFQGNDVPEEVEKEVEVIVEIIDGLREELPAKYAEDLDTIEAYIIENPEVIEKKNPKLPNDVQESVDRVKEAIDGTGSSEAPDDVEVGTEYTVVGVIEKAEYDGGPLENTYVITDETLDVELYFTFGEEQSVIVEDEMVGMRVEIDVVVTETEGGYVSYNVIAGPRLAPEDSK